MLQRLVIFDLDGTLLNTIEDLGHGVNAALEKNSLPTHPIQEYYAMVGNGVRNLVKRAMPEGLKENGDALERVLSDFFVFYKAAIDRYTQPYPGIPELLERLQDEGCLLAVASNKFQDGAAALTGTFFPKINFISVLGNRPGAPLKPSPLIIEEVLEACRKNVLEACREKTTCKAKVKAIMVGDSAVDIATAKAAGIPSIAVSWGFRSREELTDADLIADSAPQLYDAIISTFGSKKD